ncbi:MAG: NDP-sugar synthase [Candidatus Aquilonibacter sp.]
MLTDGLRFYGYDAGEAYWCDIGTPNEYRRASADVINGVFSTPDTRANGADPTARIAAGAAIDRNVWIGAHASIGENVRIIGPSVIGDGTVVEDGAIIEASIVWEASTIGAGAQLRNAIVGKDTPIDSGSEISDDIVAVATV